MNLEELTTAVCQIARRAGEYIATERERFQEKSVERKHAHDYVSYVDKGSEKLIVEALQRLLPEAGFVTEEGTVKDDGRRKKDDGSDFIWVVDPLDGTTNFIHRFPPYCVSIALCQGHEILLGVVYEVTTGECYYAWQGGGAYMDGQRISVSSHPLDEALLCLQLPYNSDAYRPVIHTLIDRFYGHAASVRMMGSAAMALCYVAAGRLDGYVEKYIGRWDYMAGALIVQEAGGRVTDFEGQADFTQGNSVVASNGLIHEHLIP
jgi:myo-inositol-1(or 4)-monophosphatase